MYVENEKGIVLFSVISVIFVMSALLATYFTTTRYGIKLVRANDSSLKGFYSAESGLGTRAEEIRALFEGFNLPTGTTPELSNACEGSNMGSGDFVCKTYSFNKRDVSTFVSDISNGTPTIVAIPSGEPFAGLSALEYRYDLRSESRNSLGKVDAILGLRMKSRLIPAFQFVAFSDDDLEIYPAPYMALTGPIHSNHNVFLASRNGLDITGPLTASLDVVRGKKPVKGCIRGEGYVSVNDPDVPVTLRHCENDSSTALSEADIEPYNGNISLRTPVLALPPAGNTEMGKDFGNAAEYWNKADLRIVLELNGSNNVSTSNHASGIVVRNADDSFDSVKTLDLHNSDCASNVKYLESGASASPVGTLTSLVDRQRDNPDGVQVRTLEVDMQALLNCAQMKDLIPGGLGEDSHGGLVIYLGIDGPDRLTENNYGVRLTNAAEIVSTIAGAPRPKGLTVATSQPMYLWGDYNSVNKIPASVVTDRINLLSNAWVDSVGIIRADAGSEQRIATDTTYQTAVISGIFLTGGDNYPAVGGVGFIGRHNGGLQNFFVLNERWSHGGGSTLTYLGSMVSFGEPSKANYPVDFGNNVFGAPTRVWGFDEDFLEFDKLPPLTPNFVYLRQELFTRYFQQD